MTEDLEDRARLRRAADDAAKEELVRFYRNGAPQRYRLLTVRCPDRNGCALARVHTTRSAGRLLASLKDAQATLLDWPEPRGVAPAIHVRCPHGTGVLPRTEVMAALDARLRSVQISAAHWHKRTPRPRSGVLTFEPVKRPD